MMNVGLEEGDESEEEDVKDEKVSKFEALSPFKDLYPNSEVVKAMKEYGPSIVPLTLVGMLMNYAGNHLL